MSDAFLDALGDAADATRPAVPAETARARMRAALAAPELDVLDDPSRFIACRTARAAGKTTTMVSDALEQMSSIEGWRGCYFSLTKDSGIEQLWDELRRQDAEFGFGLKWMTAEGTVIYPPTGARLRVRSLDSKKEVNKARGKQYHRIYLDECQSVDDEVLAYAIVTVLPPTLSRFHGAIRLGGTPRMRCEGWWYALTGPPGLEPQRMADGSVRVLARPWDDRSSARYAVLEWSWSLHTWPRSANPSLSDADRETETMRRALAVTDADRETLAVEFDGEWPHKDETGRLYRFDAVTNTWVAGAPEANYGLPAGHDWGFYLGADLAYKRDKFALTLGACAPTSRIAYHCDEFAERRLTTEQMAGHINRFRGQLGNRLKAIVGDSQGPTGHLIFEELVRVHGIPIEKAKKGNKDDAVELVSSDLVAGRMLIRAGSQLAQQLRDVKKPLPNVAASKQPKQDDDLTDSWLYTRRRMTHGFGREKVPQTDEAARKADHERQLRAIQAKQRSNQDPMAALRGGNALRRMVGLPR